MADPQVNFFKSTLVGTYSDSDTSLTLATGDGALLPDPSVDGAFNLTIFEGLQVTNSTEFEIVRVTARSGDILTVTRGQESTTPLTIGSATHSILMSATKKTFDDINDAIANVDLTTLTGVEELTFDSTGDEEFGLPAGTTAQRPSSPSAGYSRYNTETAKLEIYSGGVWGLVSLENVRVMQTAQLSVTAQDAVASSGVEVEYLVIAGGGGGGDIGTNGSGGGGAGGYRTSAGTQLALSTDYTVTVGSGGASGSDGSDSIFNTITSTGGGAGGTSDTSASTQAEVNGKDGGSGGGGAQTPSFNGVGGSGDTPSVSPSQGNDGGDSTVSAGVVDRAGGGGGGASQVGGSASTSQGGDGGDGKQSSITGSAVTRAGGGGGGVRYNGTGTEGAGGVGGGASGGSAGSGGLNGVVNTGGGGGGSSAEASSGTGGSGGSGIVILKYPDTFTITVGAGLTSSTSTSGGYSVTQFTAGTDDVSFSTT